MNPNLHPSQNRLLKSLKRSQDKPNVSYAMVGIRYRSSGKTAYQLTDHLGNVRAVVMDNEGQTLSLTNRADYYPFGMPMPNRQTTDGDYRYAYQGQEKDKETGKEAFELRLWDNRIGRWLTTDPAGQYSSPYLGMGNNPIARVDPDGGKDDWYTDSSGNYVFDSNLTAENASSFLGAGETYVGESFFDFNKLQSGDAFGNLFSITDGSLITSFLNEVSNVSFLEIERDIQTPQSTTSQFTFENVSGFFLEPAGPDTTLSGQNKRIPSGVYRLILHNGEAYQNVYKLYNDQVPQSRAILIHVGNYPANTKACLLPGSCRGPNSVGINGIGGDSTNKLNELNAAINAEGVNNVRVRIHNNFHRGIPYLN